MTAENDRAVLVIDPKAEKVLGSIPTGRPDLHMLAISPDGRWGHTANIRLRTVDL